MTGFMVSDGLPLLCRHYPTLLFKTGVRGHDKRRDDWESCELARCVRERNNCHGRPPGGAPHRLAPRAPPVRERSRMSFPTARVTRDKVTRRPAPWWNRLVPVHSLAKLLFLSLALLQR